MLFTKQKVLRRFWYATLPIDKLNDGPKPFTLLGENIVLFLDDKGEPAALRDRCCHRTARLSKGWSRDGHIICGYHGWEYDRTGKLVDDAAVSVRAADPGRQGEGVPLRDALRLRLGRARRTAARHSRPAGGQRSRLIAASISSTTAGTPARCG